MNLLQRFIRGVDRTQQQRRWLAFGVAVWKKFGDDQAGNLAALVAYYAFASLFPLLLVLVTVLSIVLRGDPALQSRLTSSAVAQFPGMQQQLKPKATLQETGPALVIGLILIFLAARGVANAIQNALNTVWMVPLAKRPGFPWNQLRSIGLIVAGGIGILITSSLSGVAATASVLPGPVDAIGAIVVSFALNIGVFWIVFRLGTAREVGTRELFLGALLAAFCWQVLQYFGTYILGHQVAHSRSLYGVFGIVLGLLAWLYLQAQLTLYAVEVSVVRSHGLWPRSLAPPPLTAQDRKALALYAQTQQRQAGQEIEVDIPGHDHAGSASPDRKPEQRTPG